MPVEIATEAYRYFGPLSAQLAGRRIIDTLNDDRVRSLRVEPARVRPVQGQAQRELGWADIQKDTLLFLAPAKDAGPVNPEYRVEKSTRRVTLLTGPYEIDANWHAASDLAEDVSLFMHVRAFFVVTDAVVRRGDCIESWPMLAVRRAALQAVWDSPPTRR